MRFKVRSKSPLRRLARRFRGYPAASVAFYGPDDQRATKVAVGINPAEDSDIKIMSRWFLEDGDIREDPATERGIMEFLQKHQVRSVVITKTIIGCPHEEGIDYPDGEICPKCPFWAGRDRWRPELERYRRRE